MKRLILFFLACNLFVCGTAIAQGWTKLGTDANALNANNAITALCADTGGIIYASGGFTDSVLPSVGHAYVAQWNGTSWRQLGTGINEFPVYGGINTLCVDNAHNLYAAGGYDDLTNSFFVAKWNGSSWDHLGSGPNALHANSSINSLCSDNFGNIYAAGQFTDSASSTSGHCYVAKWNGITWSQLGVGSNALNPDAYINKIICDRNGSVYAAGDFRTSSGFRYYYVAKWNGTSWTELGSGTNAILANGSILALCADQNDNIYAAGVFSNSDGYYYVAKWDGIKWSEAGSSSSKLNGNGFIFDLCVNNLGHLFASGHLYISSPAHNYVAKFNGESWTSLGTASNSLNANSAVFKLCAAYGSIYAAGSFTDSLTNDKGHAYVAEYKYADLDASQISKSPYSISISPTPSSTYVQILVPYDLIDCRYEIFDFSGDA